jgi:hypothetical protein
MTASDINPATGKAYAINPDSGVWDDNWFAKTYGGSSNGESTQSYDDLLKSISGKTTAFATGVNEAENSAFNDYLKYISGTTTPLDFYTKISEEQGIPQLQKTSSTLQGQIYSLEDTLRNIEPNVNATTKNSLVTEAQRQGIVTEKQKPIIENLSWQSQSLGRISSALSEAKAQALTLTDLYGQGVDKMVDVYKTKLELVSSQGDRALNAFLTDLDNEVNITLAKIKRGEEVSDQEAQNAFAMLQTQKEYENNVKLSELKAPTTEIVEVGGHKKLVNKNTGEVIADLGSTSAGGTGTTNNYYTSDWEIV